MIPSLAWKNIWRSKRRSFVVIGAIILGVWALIFIIAFYNSFIVGFRENAVKYDYSHVQIQDQSFIDERDLKNTIDNSEGLEAELKNNPIVESYSKRQIVAGMIASPKNTLGINVYGIVPELEASTTRLDSQLVEGDYFESINRNPVLISEEIARKLKVKLRSKIVITFQDKNGDITAGSFRVSGIFNSRSPQINQSIVYVKYQDLSRISLENGLNEIAILLNSFDHYDEFKSEFDPLTSSEVRSFREIAPVFDLLEQSSKITQQLITIIIMLALLFGIVNTMLMAVLERTKEIGMLRSVGMHRRLIFLMIMVETVLLGLVSAPFGLLLGYLTVYYLNNNGVDFSRYADALNDLGYDTIFYPFMENHMYFILMAVVLFTSLVGAIYPALKAININPLEAIRKL